MADEDINENNGNDTIDDDLDAILDEARQAEAERRRARRKRLAIGACAAGTALALAALLACRKGKKCPACAALSEKMHCPRAAARRARQAADAAKAAARQAAGAVSGAAQKAADTAADAAQAARTAAQTAVSAAQKAADSAAAAAAKAGEVRDAASEALGKVRAAAPIKPPTRIAGVYEVTRVSGDAVLPERARYAVDMRVRRVPTPPTPVGVARAAKAGIDDARAFVGAHSPKAAQ